jgi:hypothetical protein
MQNKTPIIIIAVLSVLALGLGYWYGLPKEGSGPPLSPLPGPKEPEFLKKGLVAYYPFNGNAKDESGNGNDGSVEGAILVEDRYSESNRSYSFDGKDDLIELPASDSINTLRDFSVSIWVNAEESQPGISADAIGLITRWDTSKVRASSFGVWIKGSDQVGVCVWPNGNWARTASLKKQIWQHVVCSYSQDPSKASLYVNGDKKQKLDSTTYSLRPSDISILLGADNYGGPYWRFFTGELDDIRIYNRALSEAEVKELYEFEKAN